MIGEFTLDPACGSGSFLLGAYQYLLDWHRDWYLVLEQTGAEDIASTGETKGDVRNADKPMLRVSGM
jgi:type I restriction-modification system DNA methylase subunit